MNLRPLGNRILVTPIIAPISTTIVVPGTVAASTKPTEFEVVAVGTGKDISVKIGDRIISNRYAGTLVKLEDEEYRIMNIDDVVATVERS